MKVSCNFRGCQDGLVGYHFTLCFRLRLFNLLAGRELKWAHQSIAKLDDGLGRLEYMTASCSRLPSRERNDCRWQEPMVSVPDTGTNCLGHFSSLLLSL